MSHYRCGQRVQDVDGFKCSVRYVGPVAASKNQTEIWVGVEWDDKSRGKHDGSCIDSQGKFHRYFECDMGAGSFVKPSKIAPTFSFFDALKARYVEMEATQIATAENILPDCFVSTAGGNQKSIEFVGELKIRKWQQIDVVNKVAIRGAGITHIGQAEGVKASHLDQIDLQDNLLWEWSEIGSLCTQVTDLRSLHLHNNKMQHFTVEIAHSLPANCFQNIRVLALNQCGLNSWNQVVQLAKLIPNIEELYVSSNNFQDMEQCLLHRPTSADATVFANVSATVESVAYLPVLPHLTILDVSHCQISSWTHIELVLKTSSGSCVAPGLSDLLVDGNPIESITPCPASVNGVVSFPGIQRLSASTTKLSSWSDIDALATYTTLRMLRITHVPLFADKGVSEIRPLVVGRIELLQFFNGSPISARERNDSEKSYLRRIKREIALLTEEMSAAANDEELSSEVGLSVAVHSPEEVIRLKHPRYGVLNDKFGTELLPMGDEAGRGNMTMNEDLVPLTFNNIIIGNGSNDPLVKKLPSSVQIGKLKQLVKALFQCDLSAHLISLSFRAYKDNAPPLLLDDDSCTLSYYGVTSEGGDIYINEMKEGKK